MRFHIRLQSSGITFAIVTMLIAPVDAQRTAEEQLRLARQITTGTEAQRQAAAQGIVTIPSHTLRPELLAAIVSELNRYHLEDRSRAEMLRSGRKLPAAGEERFAYYSDLLDVACKSQNPIFIEPLIEAVGTGHPVVDALAAFGDQAVPSLVKVARDSTDPGDAESALYALRLAVERGVQMSGATKAPMAGIARGRLSGTQNLVVAVRAMELAVALNDPEGIELVRHFSSEAPLGLLQIERADQEKIGALRRRAAQLVGTIK